MKLIFAAVGFLDFGVLAQDNFDSSTIFEVDEPEQQPLLVAEEEVPLSYEEEVAEDEEEEDRYYNILALDGGGIRGLIPA